MSFYSKLFAKKKTQPQVDYVVSLSPECAHINKLNTLIDKLLHNDHYVARSEYLEYFSQYKATVEYFSVLAKSGMLGSFCAQNGISDDTVFSTIKNFESLITLVDKVNDSFIERTLISEKDYLDHILYDVDPLIILDDDQRKAILTDEDYCLVIAGAGAGKTTTVAAKVKYLVEKKNIDPKDILVISFTNKAVGELREKINKDLKIDCPIATFHSTGNAILHIHSPEQLNIVDNSKLYFLLQDYFKSSILNNENLVNNLILFFASYFDVPYEGADLNEFFNKTAKANYTTMRSDLDEFKKEIVDARTRKNVTIQNEVLRSYQEVEIANFLYLNNIEYEYEPVYPYNISFSRKPYTPDFIIKQGDKVAYIEHFGITESGQHNRYTEEEITRYKHAVNDKIKLHRAHGTTLIYTFSGYKDHISITTHLQEKLEAASFELNRRPNEEIMHKLVSSEESKYIRRLVNLICRFITNFKTNGYTVDQFDRMYHSTKNVRSKLFLNICQDCFLEYERYLKENNAVDFEDMINESTKVLSEVKEMKQRLHFKYIIVDEYQDISRQRFDLTTALSEVTEGKIIAVGDDWQSIYAFSGSDISLFTKFEEKMGYAKLLKIVRTYRNSQDVIDIAGNFIQRNPSQIVKQLISPKHIADPVIIYTYDTSYKKYDQNRHSGAMFATANAVETALEQIMAYNIENGIKDDGTILLLGRYGFDGDQLERSGLFEYKTRGNKIKSVKYPALDITFMTVHMAKGLGYDNVIVVNGKNDTYGFPSKIEDDPVLSFVLKGDNSIDYAEERRLFYVAMTRTKNRVYFIAPEQNPSEFLLEIKHDYINVILKGNWNEDEIKQNTTRKTCPICGYPMQYRYKNSYGLRLHLCTNDPELCGFMTNEYKAGKLAIMKCDKCRDGYMIVKFAGGNYFLGCTNYKTNKTGCNNTMSADEYFTLMNFASETTTDSVNDFKRQQTLTTNAIKSEVKIVTKQPANNSAIEAPDTTINVVEAPNPVKNSLLFQTQEAEHVTVPQKNVLLFPEYEAKEAKLDTITFKQYNLNQVMLDVLSCLNHISEHDFYGITILIATLRGGNKKQMQKDNLHNVPMYGLYADMTRDDMRAIVQWILDNHYIHITKEYYPKLHPTYEGNHYIETITLGKLKKLKTYLEDPNREIFESEEDEK